MEHMSNTPLFQPLPMKLVDSAYSYQFWKKSNECTLDYTKTTRILKVLLVKGQSFDLQLKHFHANLPYNKEVIHFQVHLWVPINVACFSLSLFLDSLLSHLPVSSFCFTNLFSIAGKAIAGILGQEALHLEGTATQPLSTWPFNSYRAVMTERSVHHKAAIACRQHDDQATLPHH